MEALFRGASTVTFDVRGRLIKVLPELIRSHPSTLLAQLVDDIGTDCSEPIFVDANPDRFLHILDWYRYGRMFLQSGASVVALLHDAAFFLLPEKVIVDGIERQVLHASGCQMSVSHTTTPEVGAAQLQQKLEAEVLNRWPEFDEVLKSKVQQIEEKLLTWARMPGQELHARTDFLIRNNGCFAMNEYTTLDTCAVVPVHWAAEGVDGICSIERLRVLASKLETAGYSCNLQRGDTASCTLLCVKTPMQSRTSRGVYIQRPVEVKILHPDNGLWCSPNST
eukprot:TRINITY_DN38185_c0_g1_i1.p1 TRINITY_DN38185_c0_g1~~TRINITY_DN38185_c0_g1_i1.p1  ORF type:complete len:317 (+),score=28.98 TRINITY_DN38185_c0_g1_i1:114-953(+)